MQWELQLPTEFLASKTSNLTEMLPQALFYSALCPLHAELPSLSRQVPVRLHQICHLRQWRGKSCQRSSASRQVPPGQKLTC